MPFSTAAAGSRQNICRLIQEKFPVPVLGIPLFDHEPEGLKDIRALSIKVFDAADSIDKSQYADVVSGRYKS